MTVVNPVMQPNIFAAGRLLCGSSLEFSLRYVQSHVLYFAMRYYCTSLVGTSSSNRHFELDENEKPSAELLGLFLLLWYQYCPYIRASYRYPHIRWCRLVGWSTIQCTSTGTERER